MNAPEFLRQGFPEALSALASMPVFLAAALERAGPEAWRAQPAGGGFSLVEHACHLRDLEREGYLARLARMLSEARPELAGFDGAAVALGRDYRSQDADAAARDFAAARAELVRRLAALGPEELAREGVFAGRTICVTDLVAMVAGHDREHREEIARLAPGAAAP